MVAKGCPSPGSSVSVPLTLFCMCYVNGLGKTDPDQRKGLLLVANLSIDMGARRAALWPVYPAA